MTRVKVCGITNIDDALAAVDAGADTLGFVFAPSPRQVDSVLVTEIRQAIPDRISTVGVFVAEPVSRILHLQEQCGLDYVQVHGSITFEHQRLLGDSLIPVFTVRNDRIPDYIRQMGCSTVLLDAYHADRDGSRVEPFDWSIAKAIGITANVILAGGLTPDNITEALETARPAAVDVSSGVEAAPGTKDHKKLNAFIQRVRTWDSRTNEATSANSADGLFLRR